MKNKKCLYCGGKFNPIEVGSEEFCCLHCSNSHSEYMLLKDFRETLEDGVLFAGTIDEWLDEVEKNDDD